MQGAEVAFGNVKDIAASKGDDGTKLVDDIETEFAALDALLAQYGSLDDRLRRATTTVTEAQRKELSDQVNALAEPLSQLTHTVLGVAEPDDVSGATEPASRPTARSSRPGC